MKEAKVNSDYEVLCQIIRETKYLSENRREELLQACRGLVSATRSILPAETEEWFELHAHQEIYTGAIGGHIIMITCCTAIGDINTYRCSVCREEAYIEEFL